MDQSLMKKLLIVSDSDLTLKNGVSVTWNQIIHYAEKDFRVSLIEPNQFKTVPCPVYPEIPLAICYNQIDYDLFKKSDYIHIATEGPLGLEARKICKKLKLNYTTSFHTNYAEYFSHVVHPNFTYQYLKWFHKRSKCILVPTQTTKEKLESLGFKHVKVWTRGVDHDTFRKDNDIKKYDIPTFICVSRVAKEKNLEDFFKIKLPFEHQKIMIGSGPLLNHYREKYPDVKFLGKMDHVEVSKILQKSHVFVFTSKTDTFGIVMLEAIACGLPIVAYNVEGPRDVVRFDVGILVEKKKQLANACEKALNMKINDSYILDFTWKNVYEVFKKYIVQ